MQTTSPSLLFFPNGVCNMAKKQTKSTFQELIDDLEKSGFITTVTKSHKTCTKRGLSTLQQVTKQLDKEEI